MKLIRSYVLAEHAAPFTVTLGGLTGVLLLGNILKFAELVINQGVSSFDLLRLLIYLVPYMLSFTIPMACLIAMVLAFGRLNADYELIALRACGVPPFRLAVPVLAVGLIVSVLLLALNSHLVPESHLAFRRQLKAIGIRQPTAYLEAGTFIKEFEPYTIFVYQVRGKILHDVRIYEPQEDGPTRTIIAEQGRFEKMPDKRGVQLKLTDGTVDQWDPARPGSFFKVGFDVYTMLLRSNTDDPERIGKKMKEMTFEEMISERNRLQSQGIDPLPVTLELHRKIAGSFAPLVFVAFGLAFGLSVSKHERLTTYVWVLIIFMAYYLGMVGMSALALKQWLPAWLAMWLPNFVGWAVGGGFMLRTLSR